MTTFAVPWKRKVSLSGTGLVLLRDVAFHIRGVPDLENQQGPERFSIVFAPAQLFIDQTIHVWIIEDSLFFDTLPAQPLQHQIFKLTVQPLCEGNAKAFFLAVYDIAGQVFFGDLLENVLGAEMPELVFHWQAANEINNIAEKY